MSVCPVRVVRLGGYGFSLHAAKRNSRNCFHVSIYILAFLHGVVGNIGDLYRLRLRLSQQRWMISRWCKFATSVLERVGRVCFGLLPLVSTAPARRMSFMSCIFNTKLSCTRVVSSCFDTECHVKSSAIRALVVFSMEIMRCCKVLKYVMVICTCTRSSRGVAFLCQPCSAVIGTLRRVSRRFCIAVCVDVNLFLRDLCCDSLYVGCSASAPS